MSRKLAAALTSIAKRLGEKLGGKWKYDGCTTWWCDDGKRHVSRCCGDFYDDAYPPAPSQYWLYEEGRSPRQAEEFVDAYCPLSILR